MHGVVPTHATSVPSCAHTKSSCFSGGTATGLHGPSSLTYGTTRPTLTRRVLRYLKTNLPELGHRAGRGQIVLRLKGLGRTELPVWVRLLHGCLRGVDILRHGRARRSVSGATRSGRPQAGVRATWRTWRLVACLSVPSASLKRRASCTTTRTHARLRSHSQHASGRGGEGGREGARGGRGARGGPGTPRRLLDARAQLLMLRLLLRLQLLAPHLRRGGRRACAGWRAGGS